MTSSSRTPALRQELVPPLSVYEAALLAAGDGRNPVLEAFCGSWSRRLPVARWCGEADASDAAALRRLGAGLPADALLLDIGCGPGRHTAHLLRQDLATLGIDVSGVAVELARNRGVAAVVADVLALTETWNGMWDGILLLDGNIGIGGDEVLLLHRVRRMLAPGGLLLLELDAGGPPVRQQVQITDGVLTSEAFSWARPSSSELPALACAAGLTVLERWSRRRREFALLTPSR